MRYDELVLFIKKGESEYNPDIGGYEDTEPVITKYYCNISDMGNQLKVQTFGKLNEEVKVLRFQGKVLDKNDYDHIMIGSKKFVVELQRGLRHDTILYVKEIRT